MDRLLLIRHAPSAETRRAAFPSTNGAVEAAHCPDLDPAARAMAAALGAALPPADRAWSSYARRTIATAEAAGLRDVQPRPDLAEGDFGTWAGRTPDEVATTDAEALTAWYADPSLAPHGGEPLAAIRARARAVLDAARAVGGTTIAVTHGGFIRVTLLEVLGLPATALWQLDIGPCSVTELHPTGQHWRIVRSNWTPSLTGAPRGVVTAGVAGVAG